MLVRRKWIALPFLWITLRWPQWSLIRQPKSHFRTLPAKPMVRDSWRYLKASTDRIAVMPAKAGIQNRPIGRCFFQTLDSGPGLQSARAGPPREDGTIRG